jgi:hypothetical protein
MHLIERQLQLVAYVAGKLEEAALPITMVEDTGGKIVFHLTGVTDKQIDAAVPAFESIERECRYQQDAFGLKLDLEVRFAGAA